MATPTYTLIEEQVLGSSASTVTFSSIPGTYKDLVIEFVGNTTGFAGAPLLRLGNGSIDSGTNYSTTILSGNDGTANSVRDTNGTGIYCNPAALNTSVLGTSFIHIMSYANTNLYKTVLNRSGVTDNAVRAAVGLWRSTSAVNTAYIFTTAYSFATGSTFRLWGIA